MFYEKVLQSAEYIRSRISCKPETAVILGTGLGGIVDAMEDKAIIPYADIPNFPRSTVQGHAGNLVIGRIVSLQSESDGKSMTAMIQPAAEVDSVTNVLVVTSFRRQGSSMSELNSEKAAEEPQEDAE
jgi:purine nucleoside phosphorylase